MSDDDGTYYCECDNPECGFFGVVVPDMVCAECGAGWMIPAEVDEPPEQGDVL